MVKKTLALLLALLSVALAGACSAPPSAVTGGSPAGTTASAGTVVPSTVTSAAAGTVTVVVTRDFGRELILEKDAAVGPETSALEALQAVAEVGTKYGGGFVSTINGVGPDSAGGKEDWFFYINGTASSIGAGDYILRAGDVEHWDLRDWGYQQFVPAIIGAYPQPFLGGYAGKVPPTAVVYEDAFAPEAGSLVKMLREDGVAHVSSVSSEALPDETKQHSNLIITAGPENVLIADLNHAHKKLGLFAYFEQDGLTVLDEKGSASGQYGAGSGLVQATQNPWNPRGIGSGENVVWMVTGPDADGVRSAAAALVNGDEGMRRAYAAVVSRDGIVKIP